MDDIVFAVSDVCSAFMSKTIGSKVTNAPTFLYMLRDLVKAHDGSKDRAPGQHFIVMPDGHHLVSAGDGLKSDNPNDYVVRHHREGPKMFLKRKCAGNVQFLACVVYTREAYLTDPDYDGVEDIGEATHVIVAVIASSGPSAPVTPFRFVHNLAEGNNEYLPPEPDLMDEDVGYTTIIETYEQWAKFIVGKAREVRDYWTQYGVVAD
jgi:hypothetical protein